MKVNLISGNGRGTEKDVEEKAAYLKKDLSYRDYKNSSGKLEILSQNRRDHGNMPTKGSVVSWIGSWNRKRKTGEHQKNKELVNIFSKKEILQQIATFLTSQLGFQISYLFLNG